MRSLRTLIIFCLLGITATVSLAAEPAVLLYTARADGRIENCRCPSDPYGALEKRLPEIERMRELGPLALVDAGNFFPETRDSLGATFMLQAYKLHNYDAVTVGYQELGYGAEWMKQIEVALPIVSANLSYRDGSPVGERVRVIQRGGYTWAITGITTRESLRLLGPGVYEDFSLADVEESIDAAFADVPDDARKIVLAQASMEQIRDHEDWWQGYQLVIGGLNSDLIQSAELLGQTPYVQCGAKSRYLGVVQFKGTRIKADLKPIQTHLPDDPRVAEIALKLRMERARNRPEIRDY